MSSRILALLCASALFTACAAVRDARVAQQQSDRRCVKVRTTGSRIKQVVCDGDAAKSNTRVGGRGMVNDEGRSGAVTGRGD